MAGFLHDVRFAARLVRRHLRFSLLVAATLGLGTALTITLLSVAYGVLLRPLPWPNAERLVELQETRGGHAPRFGAFSNVAYHAWQGQREAIDDLAAWSRRTMTLEATGTPERVLVTSSSASMFRVLGVRPIAGTLFSDRDDAVAVLAEQHWRRQFAADPDAIGRTIELDGQAVRVVGVIADEHMYPDRRTAVWMPMRVPLATGNLLSMFNAVAVLRAGVTPAQAAVEGTARGRFAPDSGMTTRAIFGGTGPIEISAAPLAASLIGDVQRPLTVLVTAGLLLLAATTANLAGLQAARAASRRRDLAIRAALGATGRRLRRQLALEHLLLGLGGGALGIVLAAWLHGMLPALLPADFPRVDAIRLDATIAAAAMLLALGSSGCVGWLTTWRGRAFSRRALGEPQPIDGDGGRTASNRVRLATTTAQVAVTCVLLVGASLLTRSFLALLSVDRGYDPAGVYSAMLSLPPALYTPERRFEIADRLVTSLQRIPDAAIGVTTELPMTAGGSTAAFTLIPAAGGDRIAVQASPRVVSPGAFAAIGLRVIAGRAFTEDDVETSEPVAVVNRAFARKYLDDRALGARLPAGVGYIDSTALARVVGVVDDVRYVGAGDSSLAEVYFSYRQLDRRVTAPAVHVLIRSRADSSVLTAIWRQAIRDTDTKLADAPLVELANRVVTLLARPRLYALLLSSFAVSALVIAAVGVFGVLTYTVAQRSREFAVRAALGATAARLRALIIRQALVVVGVGLGVGLTAAALMSPLLRALLNGVAPLDLWTYAAVPVTIVAFAALACVGPAWRAARVDPIVELRR